MLDPNLLLLIPFFTLRCPNSKQHTNCRDKLDSMYTERVPSSPCIPAVACVPPTTAPLRAYTSADVSQLLCDLCIPSPDVKKLRRRHTDGVAIQGLSVYTMEVHYDLSHAAVHAVTLVQRAARLFDGIARYGSQSRLSELDFRVWLTGARLPASAINRLAGRFRTMAAGGDGMVSFAELAINFPWFEPELKCAGAYL
jgi:hypothetical protein